MKDLIKVQEYEESAFIELIKEEQERSKKPIYIVDVRKKFHLTQLAKKSRINTIFGTTRSVITLAVLVVSGIFLYKYCCKKGRRQNKIINHLNRIQEREMLREENILMKPMPEETMSSKPAKGEASMSYRPAHSEASVKTVSTDATETIGTPINPINLSEIIKRIN